MENEVEGCATPTTARRENSMPAARGGNRMPEIPDAADKIEVLRAESAADRASPAPADVLGGRV